MVIRGDVAQRESTCFARRGSGVQIPSSPPRWLERRLREPQSFYPSPWGEGRVRGHAKLRVPLEARGSRAERQVRGSNPFVSPE